MPVSSIITLGAWARPAGIHILLDLDDTLIVTQARFDRVNAANSMLIGRLVRVEPGVALDRYRAIDRAALAVQSAFVLTRTQVSWVNAYRSFGGADPSVDATLAATASLAWQPPYELYPGAAEAVAALARSSRVATIDLFTLGDVGVQTSKIESLPLIVRQSLRSAIIVSAKDAATFAAALEHWERAACVMVGNSIRSDIAPALACGIAAVHVAHPSWALDEDPSVSASDPRVGRVAEIAGVPSLLGCT